MNLFKCYQTQSTWYNGTRKFKPQGILIHSTGCNNKTIKRYCQPSDDALDREEMLLKIGKNRYNNDWNHIEHYAGLNYWIGTLADGTVATLQAGDSDLKPWGCGSGKNGSLNDTHVQFEICEDDKKNEDYFRKVYRECIELCAHICREYNIDPQGYIMYNGIKVPTICDHKYSKSIECGSNHGDVAHWFGKYIAGDYLQVIRDDISKELGKDIPKEEKPVESEYKTHTVVRGNTLWGIARLYLNDGNRYTEIKELNGLRSNTIYSGMVLKIPPLKKEEVKEKVIKVGSIVKVIGTNYYNSSKKIPAWVKAQNWVVHSVNKDRVVINKNESNTNSIMSPVALSDLELIK